MYATYPSVTTHSHYSLYSLYLCFVLSMGLVDTILSLLICLLVQVMCCYLQYNVSLFSILAESIGLIYFFPFTLSDYKIILASGLLLLQGFSFNPFRLTELYTTPLTPLKKFKLLPYVSVLSLYGSIHSILLQCLACK